MQGYTNLSNLGALSMKTTTKLALGLLMILSASGVLKTNARLSDDYYATSCPSATSIIKNVVLARVSANKGEASKLLRMHFHDCFVRGCDASVLIFKANLTAERDGFPNANSLGGFTTIDIAKAAVEAVCPRIVSCADIIALAARDAVAALDRTANVSWDVPLGRKDGNYSFATEANANLPSPASSISTLISKFAAKGLNESQMVALSGAHTIGTSNCSTINTRYYNFTGHNDTDPTILPSFASYVKSECPRNIETVRIAMKDKTDNILSTNYTFDKYYYTNVKEHKGLFTSDAALLTDTLANNTVNLYSTNQTKFFNDFEAAMVAMGAIEVLTEGYVRKNCSIAFS